MLRVGDLAGIGRISLVLPGDGGLTYAYQALRSSGPGSDKGGGEVGVGRCCVV